MDFKLIKSKYKELKSLIKDVENLTEKIESLETYKKYLDKLSPVSEIRFCNNVYDFTSWSNASREQFTKDITDNIKFRVDEQIISVRSELKIAESKLDKFYEENMK